MTNKLTKHGMIFQTAALQQLAEGQTNLAIETSKGPMAVSRQDTAFIALNKKKKNQIASLGFTLFLLLLV